MILKKLKISTIITLGFTLTLVFVFLLGVVSYTQSKRIHDKTKIMYNHPLKVRRAVGSLQNDILEMRLATRDLMLYKDKKNHKRIFFTIDSITRDVTKQFDIINLQFLGDKKIVESAHTAFISWEARRQLNFNMINNGDFEVVKNNVLSDGEIGILRTDMLRKIKLIDDFALNNGETLFIDSIRLNDWLDLQLFLYVFGISILITLIATLILYNIRKPIKDLTKVAIEFEHGNYNIRSTLTHKNEFGILSVAFNSMIESIKSNLDLNAKKKNLTDSMMITDNSHKFFRAMLPKLAELSNSQMAAVYILSEDKKEYLLYESIGLSTESAKTTFSATSFEGEFGSVLSTRKIEHIKNIPIDTTFVYQTVAGKFIPREIITIPILANNEITAIISLASVRKYSVDSNMLINDSFVLLTSRIDGILSYRKIRRFSKHMEIQNIKLQVQKSELDAQSTELQEQNRELETQKNKLSEANQLKTNFLSNMSHELRTPLNSVIALSGVLSRRLETKIPAVEYSYLEVIERNGKHLLRLINDILDISRIEAGREEIEITTFDTNALANEIINMIQSQAEQKGIELLHIENKNSISIKSDIHKCRHILQNLIANAVKFTDKGKIEIRISEYEDSVQFRIEDSGIGISDENISHIFEEFRQADSSTSRRYGGTGLGLSIAQKYANLLGGDISASSKLGVGSTFILTLPIVYAEEKRIIKEESESGRTTLILKKQLTYKDETLNRSSKTILIVDDSEPSIIQMKDFLSLNGYKVLTAQNGNEALDIISQIIPDAIILDLMMPGIDGFELLKTIREAEATTSIPVLILTAKHLTKDDLNFLKKNNVHQLIQKGDVKRDELIQMIENLAAIKTEENIQPTSQQNKINGKPSILIVEDNLDNLITVKAVLNNEYTTFEAYDGLDGVKMAKKHMPDLILMDIALPLMDGIQAFQTIRQTAKLKHIPIIALTASAMTSDRETILAYGFDSYIVKPIDEKEFFDTINRVLYGR